MLYLALLVCIFLSKPRIHCNLVTDIDYMDKRRTAYINGFFTIAVLLRHVCMKDFHMDETSLDSLVLRQTNLCLMQLIVTSFFFYSGYGLMYSYLHKGPPYAKSILTSRSPRLWLHFAIGVTAYYLVSFLSLTGYEPTDYLLALTGWGAVTNPSWFIFMTLVSYLLFAFSLMIFKNAKHSCLAYSIVLATLACLLTRFKPFWWYDTILCIPAGMAFCLYRRQLESILKRLACPTVILAAGLVLFGAWGYLHMAVIARCLGITIYSAQNLGVNLCAAVFALGITLLQGCFHYKPCNILVWAGGAALFPIYMYQGIPKRIMAIWDLGAYDSSLFVALTVLASLCLAPLVMLLQDRVDRLVFPAKRKG